MVKVGDTMPVTIHGHKAGMARVEKIDDEGVVYIVIVFEDSTVVRATLGKVEDWFP